MSEQENNGLTLEGLAQRVEALERGEAGKDQTGEETAAEFVRPASRGEQEYAGLTLQALAHRLAVLERENVSLREQALAEHRDRSTFDEVECRSLTCSYLDVNRRALVSDGVLPEFNNGLHVVTERSGDHLIFSSGTPVTALTGWAYGPGSRGVLGMGSVGVWGYGQLRSEDRISRSQPACWAKATKSAWRGGEGGSA